MSESLFSNQWYKVKDLTPQLKSHISIHRHVYRGVIWYLLEDQSSGRHHRFNETAIRFIGLLDGRRSVDLAWSLICEHYGDDAPNQHEVLLLLSQLHNGNLLHTRIGINFDELIDRQAQQAETRWLQFLANPLSQKIPLWNPDKFLQRHVLKVRWLFQPLVLVFWCAFVGVAALAAAMHWQALSSSITTNALSPYNLTIMFLLYPLIKMAHELGHGFATKLSGGAVHELGVMFLLLVPIPYVNVSAASHFRNKYTRMLVGAIGIMVELFLAASALFIWLSVEPGIVRDLAMNMMLIGGVSSLFFNGNPLLKYDGYFVLSDALELPNLAQRAKNYCLFLGQRYLFGLQHLHSPAHSNAEVIWFVIYQICSFIYRIVLLWLIIRYVADRYFIIGMLLAFWLVAAQIVYPLVKLGHFIYRHLATKAHRSRIAAVVFCISGLLVVFIFGVPFQSYTNAEGVVWMPEHAQIRAQSEGVIGSLSVENNRNINAGTTIVELSDPFLQTKARILQAKLNELTANYRAEKLKEIAKAEMVREEIPVTESELAHVEQKLQAMQVKTERAGRLMVLDADDMPGRFLKQGDLIGYVVDQKLPVVRAVVSQEDIGKLRAGTVAVELRLANRVAQVFPARIVRETPEATTQLHSEALASSGGGKLILDPSQPDKLITLEKFFLVDVEFALDEPNLFIGTRAYVRFDHGKETLAKHWQRSLRQVFLSQFNV